MAEEEQGFVIRDRRASGGARTLRRRLRPRTKSTFSCLTIRIISSASGTSGHLLVLRHLTGLVVAHAHGRATGSSPGAMPVNLPQAKEIIDLLSVLEDKTKGNLTPDEQTVLRDMLYALRMKYVTLASPK